MAIMFSADTMETASGVQFNLRNPTPDMVRLYDIAHHLSHLGRYCGACRSFYSVAQHCVLVCQEEIKRHPADNVRHQLALLHDAHEAYMGDWTRPLCEAWPAIKTIKKELSIKLDAAISEAFGLPNLFHLAKESDNAILLAEAKSLMASRGEGWGLQGWGLEGTIAADTPVWPVSAENAEALFLEQWDALQ